MRSRFVSRQCQKGSENHNRGVTEGCFLWAESVLASIAPISTQGVSITLPVYNALGPTFLFLKTTLLASNIMQLYKHPKIQKNVLTNMVP